MVTRLRVDDPDRPIETYPGYLGLYHDGSYDLDAVFEPLSEFPWGAYRDFEGPTEQAPERKISFSVGKKTIELTLDRDLINLIGFLDLLPTVILKSDEDGGDLMPGSGGILTVWENEEYNLNEITESVKGCAASLCRDFALLKQ